MDIGVYVEVLRRHPRMLVVGLLAALLLTLATAFKVDTSPLGIAWKLKPTYEVTSLMLVTQPGFPVGRANLLEGGQPAPGANAVLSQFADPTRYDYLAGLYAQLATSDPILRPVLGKNGFRRNGLLFIDGGRIVGTYTARQLNDPSSDGTLPFVQIDATADSPEAAVEIGRRATSSLTRYVTSTENTAGIAEKARVVLPVVIAPDTPQQVKGRKVIIPLVVFVLVVAGTLILCFFVENVRRPPVDDTGRGSLVRVTAGETRNSEETETPARRPARST